MSKKFLLLVMVFGLFFSFLLQIKTVHAEVESYSLLKGHNYYQYNSDGTIYSEDMSMLFVDDETSTWRSLNHNRYIPIDLKGSFNITGIRMRVLTKPETYQVHFYSDSNYKNLITTLRGNELRTTSSSGMLYSNTTEIDIQHVKSIKIVGTDSGGNNIGGFAIDGYEVEELPEQIFHNYDLTGVTSHPTNEQINFFINQYKYVFPLKEGVVDGEEVRLSIFGSDEPITYEYNSSTGGLGERFILRGNFVRLNHNGTTSSSTAIAFNNLERRSVFTTEIGEPNTASIYYTFELVEKDVTPPEEVTNVETEETETTVRISYELPNDEDFSHLEIYKNGTLFLPNYKNNSFEDTNLNSNKEYTYKIVTVDETGNKSKGVTITLKTLSYKTEMENLETDKDINGNYTFTWDSPEQGQIRVLIAGEEYKIVEASDKKIVISHEDMVLDSLGNPRVSFQVITPDGETGDLTDATGDVKFPLGLKDLIPGSMQLIASVGGFLLLALAFYFQEPLLGLLKLGLVSVRKWGGF